MPLRSKILVYLGLNDKEYNDKLKAAGKKLDKATNDWRRSGRRLQIASQQIFLGLTLPLTYLGKSIFEATAQLERMRISLATVARSKGIEGISKLTQDATDLAKLPGLGLAETFKGVTSLISVGAGADSALAVVEGLGIGIARASGTAEDFGRTMRQVTQGLAKGKIEMQDFRTILENMPEARGILDEAFGTASLEDIREAGHSVAEVISEISIGFHKLGADDFMDTMANQVENLKDSWLKFRATVGESFFKKVFKDVLGGLAGYLENATTWVNNLDSGWRIWISGVAVGVTKIALVLPLLIGLAGLFKTIMSLMFKNSALIRQLALGFIMLSGTGGGGKMKGILKWVKVLTEVAILIAALKTLFPEVTKKVDDFWKSLFKSGYKDGGVQKAMPWSNKESPLGTPLWMEEWGDNAKAQKKNIDDGISETDKLTEALRKLQQDLEKANKAGEGVSKELKKGWVSPFDAVFGAGFSHGFGSQADPTPNRKSKTSLEGMPSIGGNIKEIYGNASNQFIKSTPTTSPFDSFLPDVGEIAMANQVLGVMREHVAKLNIPPPVEKWTEWSDILIGPLQEGLTGVTETMSKLVTDIFSGKGADAFKSFSKAFGSVIQQVIKQLIAMIAKLIIAAALMEILFPGQGGLKALFKADKGSGGVGFLKSILGFADGGIVGGSSYSGDKVLARLNSGEMILNKGQQAAVSNAMNQQSMRLYGDFRIKGRDLVYTLEANQKQVNSAR